MSITVTVNFWQTFADDCSDKSRITGRITINAKIARELLAEIDTTRLGMLADETRRYLPAVMAEIAELDATIARHPMLLQRRALAFALATPKRRLNQSIHVARCVASMDAGVWIDPEHGESVLRNLPVPQDAKRRKSSVYIAPMPKSLAQVYANAAHVLHDPRSMTVESLEAINGVGPKVARMAMAVAYPHARIFTVDLWHGRQLLALANRDYATNVAIGKPAYRMIEAFFLDFADRYFPGVPTWAVQWAMWNVCEGQHRSHREIWADLG